MWDKPEERTVRYPWHGLIVFNPTVENFDLNHFCAH